MRFLPPLHVVCFPRIQTDTVFSLHSAAQRTCVRISILRITTMTKKTVVVVSCWIFVSVYCAGASAIRVSSFYSAPTTLQDQSRRLSRAEDERCYLEPTQKSSTRCGHLFIVPMTRLRSRSARKSRAARIRAPATTSLFSSLETFPSAAPRVESASFDEFTDVDWTDSYSSSDDKESAVRASIMRDRLARATLVAALFGMELESILTTLTGNTVLSSLLTDPSVISFIAALISGDDGVATIRVMGVATVYAGNNCRRRRALDVTSPPSMASRERPALASLSLNVTDDVNDDDAAKNRRRARSSRPRSVDSRRRRGLEFERKTIVRARSRCRCRMRRRARPTRTRSAIALLIERDAAIEREQAVVTFAREQMATLDEEIGALTPGRVRLDARAG